MIEERTAINGKSCVTFKQRTNEANYVYVFNGNGCNSYVSIMTRFYLKSLVFCLFFKFKSYLMSVH